MEQVRIDKNSQDNNQTDTTVREPQLPESDKPQSGTRKQPKSPTTNADFPQGGEGAG